MIFPLAAFAADLPDLDDPLRTGAKAPLDAAVVVGIADYVFLPDVVYADRDAALVRDFLISTRGLPPDRVRVLEGASREQIESAAREAGAAAGEGGTVWLYFAGHGVASPTTGRRLLLGDDTRQAPEAFDARGVELDVLVDLAGAGGAVVVSVVDACFNGAGRDGAPVVGGTRFAVPLAELGGGPGHLAWAAAGPDQFARPLDGVRHGAFTWLSVGALRGWADGEIDGVRDGTVTAAEASTYVSRSLERLGLQDQDPVLEGDGAQQLSAKAPERAPRLDGDALLHTPAPALVVGPAPPPLSHVASTLNGGLNGAWDAALVAKADALDVHLPLRKVTFGYKDLDDDRVNRRTFEQLARSTRRGRMGTALRTTGTVATTLGFAGGMAMAGWGLSQNEDDAIAPGVGMALLGATGIGLLLGGQGMIEGSVQPR